MGSLIAYSGISTKIRAMERWRLSDEQFRELGAVETVPEAVQYLRRFPPYREIFAGVEDKDLHRGNIEQHLELSQYRDFARLYKFADRKQRHFLELYFMHYEINVIKFCLRSAAGSGMLKQDLSAFQEAGGRHLRFDAEKLAQSRGLEQFILNLKGTLYYEPLSCLLREGKAGPAACETILDMLYFKTVWKLKDRCLSADEQKTLTQCMGTRIDMLNLQWICRAKKYYRLQPGEICAMLIPIRLHLTKKEIQDMTEADTPEQVYTRIQDTWYGRRGLLPPAEGISIDRLAQEINDRIYERTRQRKPYSAAVLNSYLYFKEREIGRIITVIERIRYGVTAS